MPIKSIYVRDEDLEWFDEAAGMEGDSLSSVIGKIVKEYVQAKKGLQESLSEIRILKGTAFEGEAHNLTRVRFFGKEIASAALTDESADDSVLFRWTVYLTKRGRLLLYTHTSPPCQEIYDYDIYDSLDQLAEACRGTKVPAELLDDVYQKLGLERYELLDI